MIFTPTIKKRVMGVINSRIISAQKAHDEKVKELEAKAEADKKHIEMKLAEDKEISADSCVQSIISKFI